jgi:hypothetical protein
LFLLSNTLKNKISKDKHRLNIIDMIKIGNEHVFKEIIQISQFVWKSHYEINSCEEGINT